MHLQFIKTPEFKALKAWVEDDGSTDDDTVEAAVTGPALPPGLTDNGEIGRVHVTKSQAANELAHRQQGKSTAS